MTGRCLSKAQKWLKQPSGCRGAYIWVFVTRVDFLDNACEQQASCFKRDDLSPWHVNHPRKHGKAIFEICWNEICTIALPQSSSSTPSVTSSFWEKQWTFAYPSPAAVQLTWGRCVSHINFTCTDKCGSWLWSQLKCNQDGTIFASKQSTHLCACISRSSGSAMSRYQPLECRSYLSVTQWSLVPVETSCLIFTKDISWLQAMQKLKVNMPG